MSYDEVTRFKQSVVHTECFDDQIPAFPGSFTQWVGDNIDHTVATLDGRGTFHGMGVIAVSTFGRPVPHMSPQVIERRKILKVGTVVANR